jgi:hypothetical protein
LINVNGDLLGTALGGDVLGARQRRSATVPGKPDEIVRYQRYRAQRALLPGRVSRRINDHLTHHSPTSMVRIATRDEKPGQRVGHPHSFRLRPVGIQVPQCGTHIPAALHCAGELPRRPPRPVSFIIDLSTVLGPTPPSCSTSYDPHQSPLRPSVRPAWAQHGIEASETASRSLGVTICAARPRNHDEKEQSDG